MENWNTTTDRFVGFFDIMGFKNLVYRQSHEETRVLMDKLHDEIIKLIEIMSQRILKKETTDKDNGYSRVFEAPVRPVIFSDSILLISNSNTEADFRAITFLATYVLDSCLKLGLPVKGAISLGQFTADFDKSIYFGQPLIDAYLLQDELLLYGAIFDHTLENFMHNHKITRLPVWVTMYKTPLKSGKVTHYTADWSYVYNEEPIQMRTITQKLYHTVSGKPRIYVDNTMDYVNLLVEERIKKQATK